MARGGKGSLPREVGGDPLDLLDAGTSRKMVRHAAAKGPAGAGAAADADIDFEEGDDGKIIVKVSVIDICCVTG